MSDQQQEMTEVEVVDRIKRANAEGFMTHMVVAGDKTAEQAQELYNKSDEKATQLLQKRANIRDGIREELVAKGKIEAPAA